MTLAADVTRRLSSFTLAARFMSEGKLTVFFGPSGSGKISLLSIIAGITRPDEGSIVLKIASTPNRCVFYEARLFPHLTVR
jgi:molybdate transport system ATP-binding protein